ncbi:MAG: hypothetical protein H6908_06335 [Hyphomicrobiales bacterium]|nr:hypothetical protein [Hyphomicrobiales bacterium]
MTHRRFIWFSLFSVLMLALFIALGTWQLQRLAWKEKLVAEVEMRKEEPIITLTADLQDIPEEYRYVNLAGTCQYIDSIRLQAKYYQGKNGFQYLVPVKLNDEVAVIVNLGWYPEKEVPLYTQNAGCEVKGIVRTRFKEPMRFLPQNKPEKNFWLWSNIPQLVSFLQAKKTYSKIRFLPIIVQRIGETGNSTLYPIPLSTDYNYRNDHLQYAITWYALALVTVVMYLFFWRAQKRQED